MGNTILAKGDNSAWPKGSKLSGFSRWHKIQGIEQEHRKVGASCPTSERQPGSKVSGVTEKPLSNSKDTLLISGEINNPSRNGLRKQLLLRLSKYRFPMPKLPKRRIGTEG